MKLWKTAALAAALVGAAAAGAVLAPVAQGQSRTVYRPRAVEVLSGGGSHIGVSVREVQDADVKAGKLAAAAGAVIEEVAEDGPAAKAGLRKGDIVVEFDGERVRGVRHLTRLVQETPAGRRVNTVVVRDGQRMTLAMEPRDRGGFSFESLRGLEDWSERFSFVTPVPPAPPARPAPPAARALPRVWPFDEMLGRSSGRLGFRVSELSPQLAEYFGTKEGVLVTSVTDDSPAARAGLKAGDVITSLNGSSVNDPGDLRGRVQGMTDEGEFTIGVMRDKKALTLKGKIERVERPLRRWTM
jgi:serine protease Do